MMNCHLRSSLFLLFYTAQTLVNNCGLSIPLLINQDTAKRWYRPSLPNSCARKRWLTKPSGNISSSLEDGVLSHHIKSCKWIILAPRGHRVKLEFRDFNITDACPGTCKCDYMGVRAMHAGKRIVSGKYCNDRKPPRTVLFAGSKVKLHFRLKSRKSKTRASFRIAYIIIPDEELQSGRTSRDKIPGKVPHPSEWPRFHTNQYRIAPQKLGSAATISTTPYVVREKQEEKESKNDGEEEDENPSKLTVLLSVAIPVVMIFIIVVLIIAYYNHLDEKRQMQTNDNAQNGTNIGELILTSSIALAPMVNLNKAKRESSRRKEKANKLYDDMLQSWKETNESKKERLKAKQESVNVWESYQKSRKLRRSVSKDARDDSKAFAVLVSNAINSVEEEGAPEGRNDSPIIEVLVEKPRPSSILIIREFPDDTPRKRSSKVLSWCDLSTKSVLDENLSEKRSTSADNIELKKAEPKHEKTPKKKDSAHIPAIVVSQPSFESEDSEAFAETERLIKDDGSSKSNGSNSQVANVKPGYSCAEHVKDILRDSYGDEDDEWWQKTKKRQSQGSLKESSSNSNVKYTTMKTDEEDID